MKQIINRLGILGIFVALFLLGFLYSYDVQPVGLNANAQPDVKTITPSSETEQNSAKKQLIGFPLNETKTIDFEIDEDSFTQLTSREQRDQTLDWLLFTVVYNSGLSAEDLTHSLYDIPTVRYRYTQPVANFEYGKTRSLYIGDGKVLALLPANALAKEKVDYLGHIADEQRKNLGEMPATLVVYEYKLNPSRQEAYLTLRKKRDARDFFTKAYGYNEAAIETLDDLIGFMSEIDTLSFARMKRYQLILGGRKLQSNQYRGIRVEDIAAIWQAEQKIHANIESFYVRWQKKLDALNFKANANHYSQHRYDLEAEKLQRKSAEEYVKLRLPNGSGFSLDPDYDYKGLKKFFLSFATSINLPVNANDIKNVNKALDVRNVVPLFIIVDNLKKSNDFREQLYGALLDRGIHDYSFQKARYDGDLQGTEVGMVLFYTDLLAKLWALDFVNNAPDQYIEDFMPMTAQLISPIFEQELKELPSTRLWLGHQNKGFQVANNGTELLFSKNATRIYAASSNPLQPGVEVEPNAQSEAFLGWWNNHYEEVAHYEPEYERLNEIMKWSLLISWLNEANKGKQLGFLTNIKVKHTNWFPEWVKRQKNLKFHEWSKIKFYSRNYKGATTESLPILFSEPYSRFGNQRILSGGVSLAPKQLFKDIKPLSLQSDKLIRCSNLDYGFRNASGKTIKTLEGVKYSFKNLGPNRSSVVAHGKESAKFRGHYSELAKTNFERTISRTKDKLTMETLANGKQIGTLGISKTGNGFKVGWRSREIDAGQSLARRVSQSKNLDQLLVNDPTVEMVIKLPGESSYAVKMRDTKQWMQLVPEDKPYANIAQGWDSRVSDPEKGFRNIQIKWTDESAIYAEIKNKGHLFIEPVADTGRNILRYEAARGPPVAGTPPIPPRGPPSPVSSTTMGSSSPGNKRLLAFIGDDKKIELPTLQKQLINSIDLDKVRKLAAKTDKRIIEYTSEYSASGQRFIDNLNRTDYRKAALELAKNPDKVRQQFNQHLLEQLAVNKSFIANGYYNEAIQQIDSLIVNYGPLPEFTLRKALIQLDRRKLDLTVKALNQSKFIPLRDQRAFFDEINRRIQAAVSPVKRENLRRVAEFADWINMQARKTLPSGKIIFTVENGKIVLHYRLNNTTKYEPVR